MDKKSFMELKSLEQINDLFGKHDNELDGEALLDLRSYTGYNHLSMMIRLIKKKVMLL